MKIAELSASLQRSAEELRADLQLEEAIEELSSEQVVKLVESFGKSQFSKGKETGRDWGYKNGLQEAENLLGLKLGKKGLFKDLLEEVNTATKDDTKVEFLKAQVSEFKEKYDNLVLSTAKEKKAIKLESKLLGLTSDFEGSENLKRLAIKEFIASNNFEIDNDTITVLDNEGKLAKTKEGKFIEFNEHAETHFTELFGSKKTKTKTPPNPKKDDGGNGGSENLTDLKAAFSALHKAKTAEEKEIILKRIKELEKN